VRSINIELDLHQPALAKDYVFTTQAQRTLARILDGAEGATRTRAWTLTGPYGSGKSYFGLFVVNLMSASLPAHQHAVMQLRKADPPLARRIQHLTGANGSRGLLPVAITGHRAPLQETLSRGLDQALQSLILGASARRRLNSARNAAREDEER